MGGESSYYFTMALTAVGTFVLAAFAFVVGFNNRITEAFNVGKAAKEQAEENKKDVTRVGDALQREISVLSAKFEIMARDYHVMEVDMASKVATLMTLGERTSQNLIAAKQEILRAVDGTSKQS